MARREGEAACAQCGKRPPAPGRRSCTECLEANRLRRRERARALEAAGLCVVCGKAPHAPGVKYCASCRDRDLLASRRKREKRKDSGLCTKCGERPPEPGSTRCARCRAEVRAYWNHGGACDGDCDRCPYPDCVSKGTMLDRYREKRKRIRDGRRAAGLCTQCGAPAAAGRAQCGRCLMRARERRRGQ